MVIVSPTLISPTSLRPPLHFAQHHAASLIFHIFLGPAPTHPLPSAVEYGDSLPRLLLLQSSPSVRCSDRCRLTPPYSAARLLPRHSRPPCAPTRRSMPPPSGQCRPSPCPSMVLQRLEALEAWEVEVARVQDELSAS
ncbi:hypothetical protein GUJ93_ZPchr0014g46528 [Zizania palustris]|uniref:Uncharacterized protein n=1 Tax=Zizania palustris TaxID=103762 RepID=A0A8J5T9N1_ZIZPA|nr:hypothetical protein GUJ93_ZPchr0014g46528 [Zizania palustris]